MKPRRMFQDQYGNTFHARTVAELREEVGGGHVQRMFRDKASGPPVHVGYVIGRHWLTEYAPVERPMGAGRGRWSVPPRQYDTNKGDQQ